MASEIKQLHMKYTCPKCNYYDGLYYDARASCWCCVATGCTYFESIVPKNLPATIVHLQSEVAEARKTAEYWKAEHLAGNKVIDQLRAENERLVKALSDLVEDTEEVKTPAEGAWVRAKALLYPQSRHKHRRGSEMFSCPRCGFQSHERVTQDGRPDLCPKCSRKQDRKELRKYVKRLEQSNRELAEALKDTSTRCIQLMPDNAVRKELWERVKAILSAHGRD